MTDFSTATGKTGNKAEPVKDMAREWRNKAVDLTDDLTQVAKEQATHLGEAAKEMAGNAVDKMQDVLRDQKGLGADYIDSLAQATERAAAEFDEALPLAASYIRQASGHIQGVADTVRDRHVRELVGEIEDFARRQPTIFFGGAVILGVAAMRFLKSSKMSGPKMRESVSSQSSGSEQSRPY